MFKQKRARMLAIMTIVIFAVSTVAYAVSTVAAKKDASLNKSEYDNKIVKIEADTNEEWENELQKAHKKLPREKELELYNQGYDFYDIDRAEQLSLFCDKTPEEILKMKGKTTFIDKINGDKRAVEEVSRPWNDVIKELDIKAKTPVEELKIPSEQVKEMKNQGLSEQEINEVAIMSFNYKKEYKEIFKNLKKGKTIKELKKMYWEENINASKRKFIPYAQIESDTERILKKQYGITDQEIEKCRQYGIDNIVDIAFAKDLANKNKVKLDKVLNLKKDKKEWKAVKDVLGGGK
ncbi:MAG: hypothetical protein N3I35_19710 [Clostridia bacterium]|nr:hypothetical protein [Clostridia bacterium]